MSGSFEPIERKRLDSTCMALTAQERLAARSPFLLRAWLLREYAESQGIEWPAPRLLSSEPHVSNYSDPGCDIDYIE